jgi:hypothetical protein
MSAGYARLLYVLRLDHRASFESACLDRAPAEMSGQEEFDSRFGDEFASHIEAFAPSTSGSIRASWSQPTRVFDVRGVRLRGWAT